MKPITRQNVERAYGMYARFYDLVFGAVLEGGRRAMCDAVGAQAPAALLEVGVGTGLTLARYPAATALTGIDLSRDMLRHAQRRAAALPGRRIALHCMDAEQLAFEDGTFDCVTLPYVLSVTPELARLTAELRRWLPEHVTAMDAGVAHTRTRSRLGGAPVVLTRRSSPPG